MQADHFNDKEGLIEYNVNCFKETLEQVFRPLPMPRPRGKVIQTLLPERDYSIA